MIILYILPSSSLSTCFNWIEHSLTKNTWRRKSILFAWVLRAKKNVTPTARFSCFYPILEKEHFLEFFPSERKWPADTVLISPLGPLPSSSYPTCIFPSPERAKVVGLGLRWPEWRMPTTEVQSTVRALLAVCSHPNCCPSAQIEWEKKKLS